MELVAENSDKLCRARQVLDRIGDKWSMSVVYSLGDATKRFTELRRDIDGISQRMLTATLRTLERDGLVHRKVYPVVPPRVDYQLTPLGQTFSDAVRSVMGWAVAHADDMDEARAVYDSRPALSITDSTTTEGTTTESTVAERAVSRR